MQSGRGAARRIREKEQHRQALLQVAEQIFSRDGYHAAKMAEMARVAGFAVGTFYNFFPSKAELYTQVQDGIAREFMNAFEREVQQCSDPVAALGALVHLRFQVFQRHREFFRVFFQSAGGRAPEGVVAGHAAHPRIRAQYQEALRELFANGIRRGVFDPIDPLYQALCFDGMVNAFLRYWSNPTVQIAKRIGEDEIREIIVSRFMRQGAYGKRRRT